MPDHANAEEKPEIELPTESENSPESALKEETPLKEETLYSLFVGKYDYNPRTDDDLGFEKGDLLYIINTDDEDWWFARSELTGQEGYIPTSYVAEFNTLEAEE